MGTLTLYGIIVEYKDGIKVKVETGKMQTKEAGGQTNSGVIDHFVEGILSGQGHEIDGVEGLRALEVILAGMQAAGTGQIQKRRDKHEYVQSN